MKSKNVDSKLLTLSALALLSSTLALTVKHERGTLELAAPVKRMVALEYSFIDTLLALGITPVGGSLGTEGGDRGAPPYLRALTAKIPATGSRAQPSLETIAALRPQLILSDTLVQGEIYSQLNKLAPTVSFQSRRSNLDELNAQTLAIGQSVGREAAAKQLLADQQGLIRKARTFAKKNAPAFVAAVVTPRSFTAHSNQSFAGSFLEALGRKNALGLRGDQTQYEVSLEGLVALNPQTLVLFTAPDEKPITDEWKKSPLWQKLSAVQRGRVYVFDRDNWTRGRGPIALKLMVAQAIESRLISDTAPPAAFRDQ
ncbi:ABC transporter substrate-binding protein [Deinococcus arenicola]|uniref:ABC transporter substrate-binding protein n=1 Tax=Deinococcus arenicola TaxID=2994950 RepID=A0ABU4DPL3_9DEIO|nr:ABC transporter substrate-binding protein [Deinococcus sp. ZS9-10]MDV6373654.1 ABC transporter substrate-binding protein [Deinococcus sp. ZS9-10]